LARLWEPGYVAKPSHAIISEIMEPVLLPAPQGMISLTTPEWHFIYRTGYRRSELYHWTTDPLEHQNVADLPENQASLEHLEDSLLSMVKRTYRPWRETRYLMAFSPSDSPADLRALGSVPSLPGRTFLPRELGAVQALFAPNPETPKSNSQQSERDLLESLPYDAH